MWPVTIFADECDPSVAGQAAFLREQALDGWDVRTANGRNVLDTTESDLQEILDCGIRIQAVGSPVNKVKLDWALHEGELAKLAVACDKAIRLDTRRIRIFTPESESWDDVVRWMRPMVDLAAAHDALLLLEIDARFYSAFPDHAQRLLNEFGGPHFKAAFDFANTVLIGYRPFPDWFPWIIPHLDTLHIKDAIESKQQVCPAGRGEGQILDVLTLLARESWQGTLTLEPHLAAVGPFGGFSGVDLCRTAVAALRDVLKELEAKL